MKKYVNFVRKNILTLGYDYEGYDYDSRICPSCNAGVIVKRMMDGDLYLTKDILQGLPEKIWFDDTDMECADKFRQIVRIIEVG